jgi:hypothetical protein
MPWYALSAIVWIGATACISGVRNRSPRDLARDEDMTARNPIDSPRQFIPVAEAGADSSLAGQGTICPRAYADPRSGAQLRLVRVLPVGRGDYAVSAEQTYGARSNEWLRVHCANGTPAGFVPR